MRNWKGCELELIKWILIIKTNFNFINKQSFHEGNPFLEKEQKADIKWECLSCLYFCFSQYIDQIIFIECRRYSKDSKVESMKSGFEEREII